MQIRNLIAAACLAAMSFNAGCGSEETAAAPGEATTTDSTRASTTRGSTTTSPPPKQRTIGAGCSFLTEAEVSEAMGQRFRYLDPSRGVDCTLTGPEDASVYIVVTKEAASFYDLTKNEGAEMLDIGDRGVWLPSKSSVYAVVGDRLLLIRLGGGQAAPVGQQKVTRAKAVTLARNAIARM